MHRDLARFKTLIKLRCGLLFEGNSEANLVQALTARTQELGMEAARYYAQVHGNRAEFQELVNRLTINETYFFREAEHIRLLVDHLVPRLLAERDRAGPVRILSAGCSSGEEPYSLVMALMDKYGESTAKLFEFVGGDIDSAVLAKARDARYTGFSFRGVPHEVQQRYFDKGRWGLTLKEQVKRLVIFHELNLLDCGVSPVLRDFDVIFFRNVSIYFDAPTRKLAQQNITSLMKGNGILITGTAETLANDLGLLRLMEEEGLFYFVKGPPPMESGLARARAAPTRPRSIVVSPMPPAPGSWRLTEAAARLPAGAGSGSPAPLPVNLDALRQQVRDKRYDQALPLLDAVLCAEPGNAPALLLKAHLLINRKDFAAAEVLAQSVQACDAWSIDALLLLGLAAKWQQQPQAAIRWFKQAAYACHTCWVAHYYLADLYRDNDETERARRAYRVVVLLLNGNAADTGIQHVPFDLPEGEIRFLCEHHLGKLPGATVPDGPR